MTLNHDLQVLLHQLSRLCSWSTLESDVYSAYITQMLTKSHWRCADDQFETLSPDEDRMTDRRYAYVANKARRHEISTLLLKDFLISHFITRLNNSVIRTRLFAVWAYAQMVHQHHTESRNTGVDYTDGPYGVIKYINSNLGTNDELDLLLFTSCSSYRL